MRKIELLETERAALIDLVHREIAENVIDQRKAREALDWRYWTERLHMLRRLKAKLEREETEDDDAVHQTEN